MMKVFRMQQSEGVRLEKLRSGAQERPMTEREGQVPLILENQMRKKLPDVEDPKTIVPGPTPYKDVLVSNIQT